MSGPGDRFPELRFPRPPELKVRSTDRGDMLFDVLRGTWVAASPEEWVRQHVLAWLQADRNVPPGLIAIEKGHVTDGMARRTDIVIFDRVGKPWMLIEVKAAGVAITQQTADQAGRYNKDITARYVVLTNGIELLGWERMSSGDYRSIGEFPFFPGHSSGTP